MTSVSADGAAARPRLDTREKVAVAMSAAILLTAAVYWTVQIIDTVAMVKLAGSL
jgi:hypothetical protein